MSKAAETKVEPKPMLLNLENRIVFAKCKPFKLDIPGRSLIFGRLRVELRFLTLFVSSTDDKRFDLF